MINQSLMETSSITTRRLFAAGPSLLRRLCTATAVEDEAAAAPVKDDSSVSASASKPSSWSGMRRLFRRLSAAGVAGGEVSKVLDGFIREGHQAGKNELMDCVKKLRNFKRYKHCSEIFEWMDKGTYNYAHRDYALRIDITFKTKGIAEAEKFFESLPSEAKNLYTYGALLNCYCTEKSTDKAAALVAEMDKQNFMTSLSFNNLMTLALTTGDAHKVPVIAEEMKKRNLRLGSYSYNLLMQAYQQLNDMEAVEKTLQGIEKDGERPHWSIYSNLVAVYLRVGDSEKAEIALQKLEEITKNLRVPEPSPYEYLISFHAGIGNLEAVNGVWDSLKSALKVTRNSSYLVMLQALLKMNQLDTLEKCFEEWKSKHKNYDCRLATVMITGYLRQNKVKEAGDLFNDAAERTGSSFLRGRDMFIAHFLDNGEVGLALEHLEAAANAVKGQDKWKPGLERIGAFCKHFEEQKDVDGAEKLLKLLRKVKCLKSESYSSLLRTYFAAGKTTPDVRERMEKDGIEMTSDHEVLLEKVCPQ